MSIVRVGPPMTVRTTHDEGCAVCARLRAALSGAEVPSFARMSEGSACVGFAELVWSGVTA